jgi:hypothetical protein
MRASRRLAAALLGAAALIATVPASTSACPLAQGLALFAPALQRLGLAGIAAANLTACTTDSDLASQAGPCPAYTAQIVSAQAVSFSLSSGGPLVTLSQGLVVDLAYSSACSQWSVGELILKVFYSLGQASTASGARHALQ